jgi:hypothetical protein
MDETDTPLQRPAALGDREFYTEEERAKQDADKGQRLGRDRRVERGSEQDVAGAYNAVFISVKRTGLRTSRVVDPPNGRIPATTPEAQKAAAEDRAFRLALLQSTTTCKSKMQACNGGAYDPAPSPRLNELSPRYNTGRMNRHDGPEDGSSTDRCLGGGLPDFGGGYGGMVRRIIQTAGGITIMNDTGQGHAWQRNIVMNGTPHLPASIRQWFGDSRGRWEGNTLVIDVTNFSEKSAFQGSRDNLHLIERWTRTGPESLEYKVTVEDPTVWTAPWTAIQEFTRQNDADNKIYYEPRCYEGNYAQPAMMLGARKAELAYAEGRGPHPSTFDNATDFSGGGE